MDNSNGDKTRSENIRRVQELTGEQAPLIDFTFSNISNLQKAMLDATPDCIKLLGADGNLAMMNRTGCIALNVDKHGPFAMPWIPLLPEDIQAAGRAALARAAAGQNARFPGRSETDAGTLFWDNLLTPMIGADGEVHQILCVSRDVTSQTVLERELEDAVAREHLLAREMHHRIKNLFSLVAGLVFIADRETGGDGSSALALNLHEKLRALSRASDVAFVGAESLPAGQPVDLGNLVRALLAPYGERCEIVEQAATVPPSVVTTLALVFHEYATNSIKYGALGTAGGRVTVRWTESDGVLTFTWIETGAAIEVPDEDRQGFGTQMVERMVRAAGGRISRLWRPEGLIADLYLPLRH